MAKVQASNLVNDIRGKIGGTVFQGGPAGLVARTKTTPVNPATPFQSNQRAQMAALQIAWQQLSQDQRIAWDAWAVYQNLRIGFFASTNMTGQQAFVQANRYRLLLGLAVQETPVFAPFGAQLYTITALQLADNLSVTIDPATDTDTWRLITFASVQLLPSQRSTNRPMAYCNAVVISDSQYTIGDGYTSAYGRPPDNGSEIFIQHGLLQLNNSALSIFQTQRLTVESG